MDREHIRFLARAGLYSAIYAVLTIVLAPLSYGIMQVRVAEALTVLPIIDKAAIPGLFIGCLIANIVGGYGIIDIGLGSVFTLIAAYLTSRVKKDWQAPIPPVVINAVGVGTYLAILLKAPIYWGIFWVGLGELIACFGLGLPLLYFIRRIREEKRVPR
ncbi:QueT transporter family protein [bacterium]|nr:QueT transporter family protein [bacterium]